MPDSVITAIDQALARINQPTRRRSLSGGLAIRSHGNGPAVILVHGWQGDCRQLDAFVEPAVAAGLRVVAIDAPAHGRSGGREFTPAAYGDAFLGIGAVAGVVAHSLGSAAVMSALHRGLRPRRLVFVAPVASYSAQVRKVATRFGVNPAEFRGRVEELLGRPVGELDMDRCPLRIPTLFCHDADDRLIPLSATRQLAQHWPESSLLETSGCGHYEILRDPRVIAAVIAHLTGRRDDRCHCAR